MVMLKNPNAPATKSQLWLLHILTKSDTRNLSLTMQQASDKIDALQSGKAANKITAKTTAPISKPDSGKRMLGAIEITRAYKQISTHNWDGKTGFSIHTRIYGIFPRGKREHELSWYLCYDKISISPLQGHTSHSVEVTEDQLKSFILSITNIQHYKYSAVSDDVKPIAESKAKALDCQIEIYHLINGEYQRD